MTLNITTVLALAITALIWVPASYGTYFYLGNQPLEQRDWMDRTLPRRIILVLIAPLFWIGVFIFFAFIEPAWNMIMRKVNKFYRWRERKPERRAKAAMRRRNFVFDPPS